MPTKIFRETSICKKKFFGNFLSQHLGRKHYTLGYTFCLRYHTVINGFNDFAWQMLSRSPERYSVYAIQIWLTET